MDKYVTKEITNIIEKNRPKITILSKVKFDDAGANLEVWKKTRSSSIKNRLHNVHYAKNEAGNIVGINYQTINGYKPKDVKNDWKLFVAEKTNGFTDTGVLLLQETIQSFVYAVLGSQARTGYPIVGGESANDKQTQQVFEQIVKDTITQTDTTTSINNMRKAIASTKVRLNLAICPGVTLMPSNLVILKDEKIRGYNNILQSATKTMVFGKNNQVNRDTIAVSKNSVDTTPTPSERTTPQNNNPNTVRLTEEKTNPKTQTTALTTRGPTEVAKYVPPHNETIAYTSVSMLTLGVLVAKFLI